MAGNLCRAASAMIRSRWRNDNALVVTMRPPFGETANLALARSISAGSRKLIALTSIPMDGATDWITANCPTPAAKEGSRRTAARVTFGAICLSSCSHLPANEYSNMIKPVALPPGRAKVDVAGANRVSDSVENDRHVARRLQQRP